MKPLKIKINKRGSLADLILWLAISFVAVIFFAIWIYGFHIITTTLGGMDEPIFDNPNNSIGNISADIFGKIDTVQTRSLHTIAFVIIFFTALSIPISAFVQRSHPVFFIVYLLIIISCFMASVYISNQYEILMTDDTIGETLSEFTGASFIMLNLPIWTAIIGIIGAIFLFTGILRDAGLGGGLG